MMVKIVCVDVGMVVVVVGITDVDAFIDMDMVVVEEIMVFNSRTRELLVRGKKWETKIKVKWWKQKMIVVVVVEETIRHVTIVHQSTLLISIKHHLRRKR
jgi:hypothetical protein